MQKGNEGRKEATPTQTLTTPWETGQDILSRQDIPLQRRSSRGLKAALGGKGAGVKVALTAQPEKKSQCTLPIHRASLTHRHTAHLLAPKPTLEACTHRHVQIHTDLCMACLGDSPQKGPRGLACSCRFSAGCTAHLVALTVTLKGCVLTATFRFPFGRLSPLLVRLGELATN